MNTTILSTKTPEAEWSWRLATAPDAVPQESGPDLPVAEEELLGGWWVRLEGAGRHWDLRFWRSSETDYGDGLVLAVGYDRGPAEIPDDLWKALLRQVDAALQAAPLDPVHWSFEGSLIGREDWAQLGRVCGRSPSEAVLYGLKAHTTTAETCSAVFYHQRLRVCLSPSYLGSLDSLWRLESYLAALARFGEAAEFNSAALAPAVEELRRQSRQRQEEWEAGRTERAASEKAASEKAARDRDAADRAEAQRQAIWLAATAAARPTR